MPLGEPYRGRCSLTEVEIDVRDQAALCNFGYARRRCPHFPGAAVDAVRFSIMSSAPLRLIWIAEREHEPAGHGTAVFSEGAFEPEIPREYVPLALAFVRAYLSGKSPQGILT